MWFALPDTFTGWVKFIWQVATTPEALAPSYGNTLTSQAPYRRTTPARHDADLAQALAQLGNTPNPGADPWTELQASFDDFDEMELRIRKGEPAPSSDYYRDRVRWLRLKFTQAKERRHLH